MPRKKQDANENYSKAFPSRLRELCRENTQQVIADAIGVSRQQISNYASGKDNPSWESIAKIARSFNVSTDWLLGLTDNRTTDKDLDAVANYLGISQKAVKNIKPVPLEKSKLDSEWRFPTELGNNPCFSLFLENDIAFDFFINMQQAIINTIEYMDLLKGIRYGKDISKDLEDETAPAGLRERYFDELHEHKRDAKYYRFLVQEVTNEIINLITKQVHSNDLDIYFDESLFSDEDEEEWWYENDGEWFAWYENERERNRYEEE